MIRTLIIDDEPHAREGIRIRLREFPMIQVIGECSSGAEAVDSINSLHPDFLFLDIQMPVMNGFEVLQKIAVSPMPIIIFVTAYDKYALKAFEYHALDYLLKPVNEERFHETVKTVLSEINRRNLEMYASKLTSIANDYLALFNEVPKNDRKPSAHSEKKYLTRFMVKSKESITFVSAGDIDWIESAGDYIYIHSDKKKYLIRETLIEVEKKIDPQKFVRIHRSSIVNIERIKGLHPNLHGDFDLILHNDEKLKLSRTYRDHFQRVVAGSL